MQPRIETISSKVLIGKKLTMSFANNRTFILWNSFMPRRKEIRNKIGTELYSIQIYSPLFFDNFDYTKEFEKWAAVEVTDFEFIPNDMVSFTLPGGLYAVFLYKGEASKATETFQFILGSWLPSSQFELDDRPHFEILGEKYKHDDPNSEEEIWIPIKVKKDRI